MSCCYYLFMIYFRLGTSDETPKGIRLFRALHRPRMYLFYSPVINLAFSFLAAFRPFPLLDNIFYLIYNSIKMLLMRHQKTGAICSGFYRPRQHLFLYPNEKTRRQGEDKGTVLLSFYLNNFSTMPFDKPVNLANCRIEQRSC